MEMDTGGRRLGMVPMGLEEADSQEDDLWRRILEGGG
jgi:hypothetical protein